MSPRPSADLGSIESLHIGQTSVHRSRAYWPPGNLVVKLENGNPTGSVKDRTAYYVVRDILDHGHLSGDCFVEATSGNFGLSLMHVARRIGSRVCCVIDPGIARVKRARLQSCGTTIIEVDSGEDPDPRAARIARAAELGEQSGWWWTNQFDNDAAVEAHRATTGQEILSTFAGRSGFVVVPVGSGGTVCGIGLAIHGVRAPIKVVAVEPTGSTIFGGDYSAHLPMGAGFRGPTPLISRWGHVITATRKVPDDRSIAECCRFQRAEGRLLGFTSGMALVVAKQLAGQHPRELVLCVSADAGANYPDLLAAASDASQP